MARTTGATPKALRDRPALKDSNRHLLEAFYELGAGRAVGEVPQPIPAADIFGYAWLMDITHPADRERLFVFVRRMDAAYLEEVTKKSPPK